MNFETEIRKVFKDGRAVMGERGVKKALLTGKAKMVIVAANASTDKKEDFERYAKLSDVRYYEYPDSSTELGYKCAKPFAISSLAVIDEGGSDILNIA